MRERKNLRITGVVQGIGFRETVRGIASRYNVHGFVRNVSTNLVEIEAEGEREVVDAFVNDVLTHPPAMASIRKVQSQSVPSRAEDGFFIAPSIR
jgi:hydrogenase maturation protein HypF